MQISIVWLFKDECSSSTREQSTCKVLYNINCLLEIWGFHWPEKNCDKVEGKTRRGKNHFTVFWYAPILSFVPHGREPLWLLHCSFKSPWLLCLHFKCCSTKYTTSASPKASGLELLHTNWGLLACICHFPLVIGLWWIAPFPMYESSVTVQNWAEISLCMVMHWAACWIIDWFPWMMMTMMRLCSVLG